MLTENDIKTKVKSILAREWDTSFDSIPDNAALNNFEKWDSLNHITILLALENEMGIEVNEENIQNLKSIEKIVEHLKNK